MDENKNSEWWSVSLSSILRTEKAFQKYRIETSKLFLKNSVRKERSLSYNFVKAI